MFPIYKIYYLKTQTEIENIYVFLNNEWMENIDHSIDELKRNFEIGKEDIFIKQLIFTEEEIKNIFNKNISVSFILDSIHIDDTISTIKRKIIEHSELELSFPEIYLFGIHREKLNSQSLYDQLTQEGELVLTKNRLAQFLRNFVHFDIDDFLKLEQEEFTQMDLYPFIEKIEEIKFALGQKFIIEKNYPVTTSPFEFVDDDPILEKYTHRITSTENENLLLEYDQIIDNTIFLCTATDVLKDIKIKKISEELVTKIYFPLLYTQKIYDLSTLKEKKQHLLQTNKKMLDKNFTHYTNNINFFYNLYYSPQINIAPTSFGIKYLHFVIHPKNTIHFPIDIIFKLIHTATDLPLIKWNPGSRRENIYRLYAPQIAKDGRKIPFLKKTKIIKFRKIMGRRKSVAMAVEIEDNNFLICEFFHDGNVSVLLTLPTIKTNDEVETLLQQKLNPLFKIIEQYLEQSGYTYFQFNQLSDRNIEILNMEYIYKLPSPRKPSLKKLETFKGCISSVFNILESENQDILLQYKRISHFNKMDSIETFITHLFKHNVEVHLEHVLLKLQENFNLSQEEARLKYAAWLNEKQIERDRYENKKIKVVSHPGLPVTITWDEGETHITVQNIDNILYLKTLPIYINSIIKLTQYDKYLKGNDKKIFIRKINKVCQKDEVLLQNVFEDVKAASEMNFADQGEIEITDSGEIIFDDSIMDDDLLDMFGGLDDTDDEDEDDYISPEIPQIIPKESPETDDEEEKDIVGTSLRGKTSYFQKGFEKNDPILFLKKKEGKYKQYSRSCPINLRRQPVILTDKQFTEIQQKTPDKIKLAIQYGSSDAKKKWYICPQYWCIKTNSPLTTEDLEHAKTNKIKLCGDSLDPYKNIIPYDAKDVPEGKYIYSRVHFGQKERGQYKPTLYPGYFVGKHPNPNLCIPCCFNKPGGKQQTNRNKCDGNVWWPVGKDQTSKVSTLPEKSEKKIIKESNKFPLNADEWGYLPMSIENFLHITQDECNKDGTTCILRRGVEYSNTQSFIAAIANIYNYKSPPSISKMKEIIVASIDLDQFVTFHQGTLVELFKTKSSITTINKYKKTNLYKKLNNTPIGKKNLKEIISAFKNFKNYMKDDNIDIDYEYLWDIICTRNKKLFPHGLNLILLTIPDDDITQNVAVTCPTNHYTNLLFDGRKKTAIILIRDNFYEPLFERVKIVKGDDRVTTAFALQGPGGQDPAGHEFPWSFQSIIRGIAGKIKNKCKFLPSIRAPLLGVKEKFRIRPNISILNIIRRLKRTKYTIKKQIVNLFTKTIGVIVSNGDNEVFLPSLPSPILVDKPFMLTQENTSWWGDYTTTVTMLQNIAALNKHKKRIPCKPIFKVVDDGKIVGILTITNQFVPTHPKTLEDTLHDRLIPYYIGVEFIKSNKTTWLSKSQDPERLKQVQRIKLETNFYNTFRNMVRILLNQYKFQNKRIEIEKNLKNAQLSYWKKLETLVSNLKELMEPFVEFADYSSLERNLDAIPNITTCLNLDDKTCNKNQFCLSEAEGNCKLLIPAKHLLSGDNNEKIYYGRMADELIRYGQIRSFIFEPKKFISFQEIGYNLKEDELLLLETLLINDNNNYFTNLIPIIQNKYVKYPHTFYSAEPQSPPPYSNIVELDKDK